MCDVESSTKFPLSGMRTRWRGFFVSFAFYLIISFWSNIHDRIFFSIVFRRLLSNFLSRYYRCYRQLIPYLQVLKLMYYFYLVSFWFPFCCCCGGRIAVVHCGWPSEAKNLVHLDRHINIWWISGLIVVLMKCLWWLLSMIRIFIHSFVPNASFSVLAWNNSSYKLFRSQTSTFIDSPNFPLQ